MNYWNSEPVCRRGMVSGRNRDATDRMQIFTGRPPLMASHFSVEDKGSS